MSVDEVGRCGCPHHEPEFDYVSMSTNEPITWELHLLRCNERARQNAEDRVTAQALSARNAGASWTQIGLMLGMSKQAAKKRYDRRLPGM